MVDALGERIANGNPTVEKLLGHFYRHSDAPLGPTLIHHVDGAPNCLCATGLDKISIVTIIVTDAGGRRLRVWIAYADQ